MAVNISVGLPQVMSFIAGASPARPLPCLHYRLITGLRQVIQMYGHGAEFRIFGAVVQALSTRMAPMRADGIARLWPPSCSESASPRAQQPLAHCEGGVPTTLTRVSARFSVISVISDTWRDRFISVAILLPVGARRRALSRARGGWAQT